MATDTALFQSPVTYWPRRTGLFMWSAVSRDDIRRDFDLAAGFGLKQVSCALTWPEIQPEPHRVAAGTMRTLELLLDEASDYGLDMYLTLFPVVFGRLFWLPTWTLDQWVLGDRPIYTGAGFGRQEPRNLFDDRTLVEAEASLVREVIGEFMDHPAVREWTLGDGIDVVAKPEAPDRYSEWLHTMVSAASTRGKIPSLRFGVTAESIVRTGAVDPSSVEGLSASFTVNSTWRPAWAHGSGALWPAFLAAYVRSLSGSAAVIHVTAGAQGDSDLGHQRDELSQLASIGAAGCLGPPLIEPLPEVTRTAPYRYGVNATGGALFSPDGAPRETADLWRSYQLDPPSIVLPPSDFPHPDPERRRYSPESVAFEAFEEFVR